MNTSNTKSLQMEPHVTLRTWIQDHPIPSYILFVLAWSWSIWSLLFLVIKPGGLLHNPPPLSFLFVIIGGIGPSLGSLLITWLAYGREGMQALGARLHNWRVGG